MVGLLQICQQEDAVVHYQAKGKAAKSALLPQTTICGTHWADGVLKIVLKLVKT